MKAVVAVIDKSATVSEEAKLVEQGMSMLANITAFDILADKVGDIVVSLKVQCLLPSICSFLVVVSTRRKTIIEYQLLLVHIAMLHTVFGKL